MITVFWRCVYTILFYLALPFIYLRLLWRSRRLPDLRQRLAERLGFFTITKSDQQQTIWLHAVSVGETMAAIPLIKIVQQQYPDIKIIITSTTSTGSQQVIKSFGDSIAHLYIPYDVPFAIKKFLRKIKPKIAIFMETELWPNYLYYLKKYHIPIMVANARLSERSATNYARVRNLIRPLIANINLVAAQTEADSKRFYDIGLLPGRSVITGNMKFDLKLPDTLDQQAQELSQSLGQHRLIWIAASTHAGEEAPILAAHKQIQQKFPDSLLLLVPRHPNRFAEIIALCRRDYRVALRSDRQNCPPDTQIFIGDSMGELLLFYKVATVAFVGGSFVNVGGHNLIEPAACELPIISGPNLFNFTHIAKLLQQAQALEIVDNSDTLATVVCRLFNNHIERQQRGERARAVVAANQGAVKKHVDLIRSLLTS
ncbi:MAG: lipid IV(A) 3-deoxy-D-manno-octulosonic acid transferase [Pseudomonadota bacterium]